MGIHSFDHRAHAAFLLASALLAGCGPDDSVELDPLDQPFSVSTQFAATGLMGDAEDSASFRAFPQAAVDACSDFLEREPNSLGNCYRFEYLTNGEDNWAGVYWQFPSNNWGAQRGRSIEPNLFSRVRFRAAVWTKTSETEYQPSAGLVSFWSGGIGQLATGPADVRLAYRDAYKTTELRRPVLGEWTDFSITLPGSTTLPDDPDDLTRKNMPAFGTPYDRVIGAFAFSYTQDAGADPGSRDPVVIFIDDIVWE
jgi:hypothetical protein